MIGISLLGLLFISNKNFKAPFTYLYTIIIYGVSVPGLLSILLILYSVFSLHQDILKLFFGDDNNRTRPVAHIDRLAASSAVMANLTPLLCLACGGLLLERRLRR